MPNPDDVTIAFTLMQRIIFKAHEGPLSPEDFFPLSDRMQAKKIQGGFDAMMAERVVWRTFANEEGDIRDEKAPPTAAAAAAAAEFEKLHGREAVERAVRATKDRMRLYVSQGRSLLSLLLRFAAPHLGLALSFGLVRSAGLVLQVWALWTVIRFATKDPDYDYSTGVQYVVALMLPVACYLIALSQHNIFHVSTRAAR